MTKYLIAVFCFLSILTLPATPVFAGSPTSFDLELRAFKQINQHRRSEGLEPLVRKKAITRVARRHSRNMASGEVAFGHDGFAKRVATLRDRLGSIGRAGENVAYTTSSSGIARQVVQLWLDSSGHRANIEGETYDWSGIGVAEHDGAYYFTQIFINKL